MNFDLKSILEEEIAKIGLGWDIKGIIVLKKEYTLSTVIQN